MIRLSIILFCWGIAGHAEVLVAKRIIPANAIISVDDIQLSAATTVGGTSDPDDLVGMEARKALFAGRPILTSDVGVPAVVERNQIVSLIYHHGGLVIKTEGRALDRAGPGDIIRVMNLSSRTTVSATIDPVGAAHVQP